MNMSEEKKVQNQNTEQKESPSVKQEKKEGKIPQKKKETVKKNKNVSKAEQDTPKSESSQEKQKVDEPMIKRAEKEDLDEDWEDELEKKMSSREMKKHLRKQKRQKFKDKIANKRKELNQKTSEFVETQFVKVFKKDLLPYTIIFVIGAIAIGVLAALPEPDGPQSFFGKTGIEDYFQFIILSIAFAYICGYGVLFLLSRNKAIHKILFNKSATLKVILALTSVIIFFGLGIAYWAGLDPILEEKLSFLTFQQLLGLLLALIFFGWNAIQIFYIKESVEASSIRREAKFEIKNELKPAKKRKMIGFWNIFT